MTFNIDKIKILRNKTQAGIMDCKQALIDSQGDIEKAITFLKKNNLKKINKRNDKIASEGLTNIFIKNNDAILYELNSETDFVAQNKIFLNLLDLLGKILIEKTNPKSNLEEILNLEYQNKKIKDLLLETTAVVEEKICLNKVIRVTKKEEEGFGFYKHQNGKISTLVIINNNNQNIAEEIAMHIAAYKPKFLNKEKINKEFLNKQIENIKTEIDNNQKISKSQNIKNKIIEGRLNKFIKNICLIEQPFVKNPDKTVQEYLIENKTDIIDYFYLEVNK